MPNWSGNIFSAPLQGFIWGKLQSLLGMKTFLWFDSTGFTKGYISSLCFVCFSAVHCLSNDLWNRICSQKEIQNLVPMQQKFINLPLPIEEFLSWKLQSFTGFGWPGIISRGLQRWFMWEAFRSFLHFQQNLCQLAPRKNCHWPRLRRLVTVVELVGYGI